MPALAVAMRWYAQLFFLWTILCAPPETAGAVNRTIDDDFGDSSTHDPPSYLPDDGWAQGSICTGCALHPFIDASIPFDRTWHDSTYHPGDPDRLISVNFKGTAVYVFNLIANDYGEITTLTNLTFHIDDELVGNFFHAPTPNLAKILYQQAVYVNESLVDEPHSLEIRMNGPTASLILFDFIVYTSSEDDTRSSNVSSTPQSTPVMATTSMLASSSDPGPPSPNRTPLPIGAIVGGTVGGIFLILSVATAFVCLRRRRARRLPSEAERVDPFEPNDETRPRRRGRRTHGITESARKPDVRRDRTRHRPTADASTTGTGSSVPLSPHRPRLPPMSVAPETTRSTTTSELAQRIRTLETRMRTLEAEQKSDSSGSRTTVARSGNSSQNGNRSRGRSRSTSRSRAARNADLRREIASLREEMNTLRAELEQDQRLLAEVGPPVYGVG